MSVAHPFHLEQASVPACLPRFATAMLCAACCVGLWDLACDTEASGSWLAEHVEIN